MTVHDMHITTESDLLSAAEAAQLLSSTSAASLMRWARAGKIPCVELPSGRRFFRRSDVEEILTPRVPARNEIVLSGGGSGEC